MLTEKQRNYIFSHADTVGHPELLTIIDRLNKRDGIFMVRAMMYGRNKPASERQLAYINALSDASDTDVPFVVNSQIDAAVAIALLQHA